MRYTDAGDEFAPPARARRAAGFSKHERARGAEAIERRTAWLGWPLVYWAGSLPGNNWPPEVVYRPAASLVAERLSGAPAGLYAVRLDYASCGVGRGQADTGPVNPRVVEAVRVSKTLVAGTVSALQAALKYPQALPERVGNLEAWRAEAERRLQLVSCAVGAAGQVDGGGAGALAVEALALWVGPDSVRPSRRVPAAVLQAQCTEMAAVILGQRHVAARLPDSLAGPRDAGAVLSRWPPDLVMKLCHPASRLRAIAGLGHARVLLNAKHAVAAGSECLWAGEVPTPSLLESLPSLSDACGRLGPAVAASPWRMAYAGLAGRACAFSDPGRAIRRAAWWLEAVKLAFPQRNGEAALEAATLSLQYWLGVSRWSRPDLERLFEILPQIAPRLLSRPGQERHDARSWDLTVRSHAVLGALASLTPEQQLVLMEHSLFPEATRVLRSSPSRLGTLVSLPRRWLAAGAGMEGLDLWSRLVSLPNQALVSRLIAWLETQPHDRESSARTLNFLDELLFLVDYGGARTTAAWQSLLERHTWLCSELLERHPWPWSFRDCVFNLFTVLPVRERHASSLRALARSLLSDPERCSAPERYLELSSELAGANDKAFLWLLGSAAVSDSGEVGDARAGWSFLKAYPEIRQFLAECAGDSALTGRAWRVLQHLDLALRLQSRTKVEEWLSRWQEPGGPMAPGLPADLPSDLAERLKLLASYRSAAGQGEPLPKSIAALLEQPRARGREIDRLREMERRGALPEAARRRLENLERYEAGERSGASQRISRMRRACARELRCARLAAIESGLGRAIEEHWEGIGLPPGVARASADWRNALHLYVHIRKNRRILRKLLMEEAQGSRAWITAHPANAAFLEWMRKSGLDAQRWLATAAETYEIDGSAWTVYAETDPLRVLQMGNIFSTCLSVAGVNAFSTVANAAEANKRVLYIRNQRGATIGRRLIGIGKHGTRAILVGFRSYGACDAEEWSPNSSASPWVKILFDRFCSRLATEVGAVFTTDRQILEAASEKLPLFARWYNDGPEPFDEWVADPLTRERVLEGDRGSIAETLLSRFQEKRLCDPEAFFTRQQIIRALIWLGDDALALLEALGAQAFTSEERRFIERWTQGAAARALAGEWMRCCGAAPSARAASHAARAEPGRRGARSRR